MLWLLMLGCGMFGTPDSSEIPAEMLSCDADSDCVVVELGCCDHCNGGEAVAANRGWADEVVDGFSETCRNGMGCNLMGCAPLVAVCGEDAVCALETGGTGF